MADSIDEAVDSMSRFAEMLPLVGLPELGRGYKKEAEQLSRDRSDQSLRETREWIRQTFQYQGSGSIPDRYVAKQDGSADSQLTSEYHGLIRLLGEFVEGQ
ncbi:hypothetical protein [Arthrobacter sp. YD2]|uniref:hypothetical protein n=1 Tax=Arthrobacter sp. YD2 TaxID=3058046 RepID=UPI0025B2F850|nr:hypothetical protein [Arthrobacter sp. YD2]MDN3903872.1 hypothetical protein [Arthrobacter sp. YD2]